MTTIVKINERYYFNIRYIAVKLSFDHTYLETVLSEIAEDLKDALGNLDSDSDNLIIFQTPNLTVCDFSIVTLIVARTVSVVDQIIYLQELNDELEVVKSEESKAPEDVFEYVEALTLAQNLFDKILDVKAASGMSMREAHISTLLEVYNYTGLPLYKEAYYRALAGHPPETTKEKNEILLKLGILKKDGGKLVPTEKAKPYLIAENTWNATELTALFEQLRSLYGSLSSALEELSR